MLSLRVSELSGIVRLPCAIGGLLGMREKNPHTGVGPRI